ncbi:hypothetical protein ESZ50_11090 [Weissella muntiaci]|uniref:Uncharacterized protein n=1 Tax=Weissella muntiaci TaxID=2508881 RepID=A0A6C2C1B2_9LACO|nr:hypothetical protein ESZ50_11090 [Weissella muntiaci]
MQRTRYKFENSFGASVIYGPGSFGLELAVIRYNKDGSWDIDYSTDITDDVVGRLTPDELDNLLGRIQALDGGDNE